MILESVKALECPTPGLLYIDHLGALWDSSFQRILILELLKGQDLCGHK